MNLKDTVAIPMFIDEIRRDRNNLKNGMAVRVTGKLLHINGDVIEIEYDGQSLLVDVSLLGKAREELQLGFLCQFVGQLALDDLVLATSSRIVNGMDLALYRSALECMRDFCKQKHDT